MFFGRERVVRGNAVVGENDKPRRVLIEPPAREQSEFLQIVGEQVDNGFIASVLRCAHNA